MKHVAIALVLAAAGASAQTQPILVARVAEDAKVIDRLAEVSKRDLPHDLLRRIIDEDIDTLRGKAGDGTYQYAGYERMEQGRSSESYSVDPSKGDQLSKLEVRGIFAYRLIITSPMRRMLVTKNRRVWLERADIEYLPQGARAAKTQTVKLGVWVEPGATKTVDLDEIARSATARVYARADGDSGYGNLDVTLLEARVFDDPSSPYADAVTSLKAIQRALVKDDVPSMRSMAQRIQQALGAAPATAAAPRAAVDVVGSRSETAPSADVYGELQAIEDLMTGTDSERRQGVDRLHQLLRRLRNQPH
jgi:hypothetical protein